MDLVLCARRTIAAARVPAGHQWNRKWNGNEDYSSTMKMAERRQRWGAKEKGDW
jgi:hypothetical protein